MHYPAETTEQEAVDDVIKHFIERYFAPWRRRKVGRGFLLDFIAQMPATETNDGKAYLGLASTRGLTEADLTRLVVSVSSNMLLDHATTQTITIGQVR